MRPFDNGFIFLTYYHWTIKTFINSFQITIKKCCRVPNQTKSFDDPGFASDFKSRAYNTSITMHLIALQTNSQTSMAKCFMLRLSEKVIHPLRANLKVNTHHYF